MVAVVASGITRAKVMTESKHSVETDKVCDLNLVSENSLFRLLSRVFTDQTPWCCYGWVYNYLYAIKNAKDNDQPCAFSCDDPKQIPINRDIHGEQAHTESYTFTQAQPEHGASPQNVIQALY